VNAIAERPARDVASVTTSIAVTFAIVIALLSIGLAVGVANVGTTSPVDAGQAG